MSIRLFSIILFTVLLTNISFAQKWIISPVEVFEEPSEYSQSIGVLLRGAKVDIISGKIKEFSKVRVDNGMEVYVRSSFLVNSLNASDNYELSPSPIIENDGIYGSPHLFVTVASLRGRIKPDIKSKVGIMFTMGEPVSIKFYPYNSETWVNVKNSYFVQQKYLGARPVLEDLYNQFDKIPVDDIKKKKQIIKRITEFVWRTRKSKIPAYERYLSLAKQLNDNGLIKEILLDLEKIKGNEDRLTYKELVVIEKSNKNFIMLNGVKFIDYDLPLSKLIEAKGKPQKTIKEEDECCYSGDTRYVYKDAEFIVNKDKDLAEIVWFSLQSKGNSYSVDGFKIDSNTTEHEFVKKLSRIFQFNGLYPRSYDFPFLDYASISVLFKNGRPDRFDFSIWP